MILGIEGYGSGSDNDSDTETASQTTSNKKSNGSQPPKPASKLSSPPPKSKRVPKKITIGLPSLPRQTADEEDGRPVAKRPRLEAGAGKSSLLSMLPAPKERAPVNPAPEKVLGGGNAPSLVFRTTRPDNSQLDREDDSGVEAATKPNFFEELQSPSASLPFVPLSLKKGRANVSVEEEGSKSKTQSNAQKTLAPTMDFFSLAHSSSSTSISLPYANNSTPSPSTTAISSAPAIPTFEPPEPSQTDEYPGYYQTPSGTWAAYDPAYYAKFIKRWQFEYDAHVRKLEKGAAKGFEGLDSAPVEEVNALQEMERAKREIKEREDRKAITQGASGEPAKPKMNINASKMSGIARSRHQLSTLLKEAYENREALEEKIAQGKRNRKEAGNKYGF